MKEEYERLGLDINDPEDILFYEQMKNKKYSVIYFEILPFLKHNMSDRIFILIKYGIDYNLSKN